jgi:thymidine phosphorylase
MSLPAAALIRHKRQGGEFDAQQLADIAQGIADGRWSDAQVGAFAMAVAWQGMTHEECAGFTLAVRDSGQRLQWQHLPGPVLDKHSTGGVGDCVSLLLAPLLAAFGAYVPMISGRGLGHTGGTLDKLESIPGYDVNPSLELLDKVMRDAGCAIIGQSDGLVPADRRLYAVRDVTGTVDVSDLIVPSILSKKLAGGAQSLVLDIKIGNGAQTPSLDAAWALAERMSAVADGTGLALRVAFSDMDQVLGGVAGNAMEVRAVIELLRDNRGDDRLRELTLALAGELLCMGGIARDSQEADQRLRAALDSGAAAERFARMVAMLGGPSDLLESPDTYLQRAPVQRVVRAQASGHVAAMDVRALGDAIVGLGGGRRVASDELDRAVGLSEVRRLDQDVEAGDTLAIVHARDDASADAAAQAVRAAFTIGEAAPSLLPLFAWYQPA